MLITTFISRLFLFFYIVWRIGPFATASQCAYLPRCSLLAIGINKYLCILQVVHIYVLGVQSLYKHVWNRYRVIQQRNKIYAFVNLLLMPYFECTGWLFSILAPDLKYMRNLLQNNTLTIMHRRIWICSQSCASWGPNAARTGSVTQNEICNQVISFGVIDLGQNWTS